MSARPLVVDASVVVEVHRRSKLVDAVATTIRGATLAAPPVEPLPSGDAEG